MFANFTQLFNLPQAAAGDTPPMFAGVPLVNPLLNDAATNLEAIDERIKQLESVSQWLNMNLQMVNASVQQLQVQKQTLHALAEWQKLSQSALETPPANPDAPAAFEQMAQAWWQGLQQQFNHIAQAQVQPETETKTEPKAKPTRKRTTV
ncbi:MAG: PhaM family polyhydroxyalkanoate granule multifunctional regulatory protein [Formosimonas sp.]